MNPGSASRTLGRALEREREREDRAYQQEHLALERRLAEVEVASARSKKA